MSYQGFCPLMVEYLQHMSRFRERVTILEVGVCTGQTSLPLMANLAARNIKFDWVGIDIMGDANFSQQITLLEGVDHARHSVNSTGVAQYIIENSLNFLPSLAETGIVFDLVLLDGDHNYDTVRVELSHLNAITHPDSLVVCDDYGGKHHDKDSFYSEHDTHRDLEKVSTGLDKSQNKGGVSRAIDEFVQQNEGRWSISLTDYEPCFLTRQLNFACKFLPNIVDNNSVIYHPANIEARFVTTAEALSSTS